MIEPTETETKETLDAFADAMLAIAREAAEEPELRQGGADVAAGRGGSTRCKAAKQPVVRYLFEEHPTSRARARNDQSLSARP